MTLERKTPLRVKPRGKGNRGEREVIDLLHKYGWVHARRNLQSGGQGGGDIVEGIENVSIEVKRVERLNLWAAIAQCEAAAKPTDMPLVACRRNGSRCWYGVVPLENLLELLSRGDSDPIVH